MMLPRSLPWHNLDVEICSAAFFFRLTAREDAAAVAADPPEMQCFSVDSRTIGF